MALIFGGESVCFVVDHFEAVGTNVSDFVYFGVD